MPDDKVQSDVAPQTDPKYILQAKKMDLEAGWVGRLTGSGKNVHVNVAFVLVVLLILLAAALSMLYPTDRLEVLKIVLPIVTLTLGYLFGKNSGT